MKKLLSLVALCAAPLAVQAQNCNQTYVVQSGDTVFTIAERVYGDPENWTLIYYANEELLKTAVFQVRPGDNLFIPCAPGQQATAVDPVPDTPGLVPRDQAELKLLTGSNFAPFTDLDWPGQGLVTEIVNASMASTPDKVTYSVDWLDDWSQHLYPLLDDKTFDMGFPWYKPPCDAMPDFDRCRDFHFSEPLLEVQMLLFVRADSGFVYETDADLVGKRICRPEGYSGYHLDVPGREFLKTGQVTLVRADNEAGCFDKVLTGEADALYFNIFVGAQYVADLNLRGQIVPVEEPLATSTMHAIISKKHWRGTTLLYRFNAGVEELRKSQKYNEIVTRHLETYWERLRTN